MKSLAGFENAERKAARLIEAVARNMGTTEMEPSYQVLRAVVQAVRDRVPPVDAMRLAGRLPMLVCGFCNGGWQLSITKARYGRKRDFLDRIARDLPGLDHAQRERAATAVFSVLNDELGTEEAERIRQALPGEARTLWHTAGTD